jgi:lipoate-protein ligase A
MTGGGAMYSEPDRVITYSMIFPDSAVDGLTLVESFEHCDRWAVEALRHLDVDASYKPINDIVSPVGKIGGAAQFRRDGWVLHHTMIAHSIDLDAMCRVLRIGEVKLSDKGVRSAVKRVSPLAALSGQSREAMREGMIDFVRSRWTTSPSALRSEELVEAERLVTAKYGTLDWKRKIL